MSYFNYNILHTQKSLKNKIPKKAEQQNVHDVLLLKFGYRSVHFSQTLHYIHLLSKTVKMYLALSEFGRFC